MKADKLVLRKTEVKLIKFITQKDAVCMANQTLFKTKNISCAIPNPYIN